MEDELFLKFEEKFRGKRETIKERLRVYLPLIEPLSLFYSSLRAVDLGCGRGEWIELLQDNGWQSTGVDTNLSMVNYCQQLGLDACHNDAIAYLRSLSSGSIAVVSGFHIAEHLPFELLLEFLKESYRVLLPGGCLLIETPNPENLTVGTSSFYLDPTHLNPIPHELMLFVSEQCGFQRAKVLRLQESPDLRTSKSTDLFAVLFGVSPDYAIIAQKEASPEILEAFNIVYEKPYGISLETLTNRYDSQVEAQNQRVSLELGEIRNKMQDFWAELETISTERNDLQKNLDLARTELEHVYNSRSYRITAPMRAVLGFLRMFRDRMKTRANIILLRITNEVVKHPRLKTKAFNLLKHFPGLQKRIKGLASSVKYEISSSDFLSENPNTLSLQGRQIYFDLLKAIDNKRGR